MTEEAVYHMEGDYRLSTAIVLSVFIPKKVHPRERLPGLPVRISQPYVVLENHSGEATRPRKKFDDIFMRFDTIP